MQCRLRWLEHFVREEKNEDWVSACGCGYFKFINNSLIISIMQKKLPFVFAVHFVIIRKKLSVKDRHLLRFRIFTGLNVLSDELFFQLKKNTRRNERER